MGQKVTDGKAIDVTAPAGTINFGDLYRIGLWTGIAMKTVAVGDTVRTLALETSEAHWKIKLPAGLNPAVGDLIYWTAGTGFKDGFLDLAAAVNGAPAAKVLETKNAQGYATVKVNPFAAVA